MTDSTPISDPRSTTLLVMDYQPAILRRLPDADTLLDRAADAITLVRRSGATIGFVRVALDEDEIAAMPTTNKMASRIAAGNLAVRSDLPDAEISERIVPQPGDIVVRKIRVGAFSTTDLDAQLRARGIDTLLLAGVSTSGVVLSTVRDAADRDYRIIVVADLCGDPDPEVHQFLTERIFPRQADVVTSTWLNEGLQSPSGA